MVIWGENTPQKCPNLGFLDPFWPMKDGRANRLCWEIQCLGFGGKTHPKSAQFWGFLTHFGQWEESRLNWWYLGGKHTSKVPKFGVFGPILAKGKGGEPTNVILVANTPQKCPNLGFFAPFWPRKRPRHPTDVVLVPNPPQKPPILAFFTPF